MLRLATKFHPGEPAPFLLAHRAGFRNAELWLGEDLLRDTERLIQRAGRFQFEYVLHFPNKPVSDEALAGCLKLYDALNCKVMVIHEPMFEKFAAKITAQKPDVKLGIENHRKTPEELPIWAEEAEYLTIDVEHLWLFTWIGVSRKEFVSRFKQFWKDFGHKVKHIHFPGVCPHEDFQHRALYNSRELMLELFDFLADEDFRGFIVSEVNEEYQNYGELKMDVLLFEFWMEKYMASARFSS